MLRWEKQHGDAEFAYSGELVVGMIGTLTADPAIWFWDATNAVNMRRTAKTDGPVASRAAARKAVERGWAKWLARAHLAPIDAGEREIDA